MPNIKLPDGNTLTFEKKVTGLKIAEKISKSLSKQALVISVDGNLRDLNFEIENGKLKVVDMLQYIRNDYESMEPEDAWHLVRKWWINLQEENKVDILIDEKEKEIRKLQNEVAELTNIKENEKYESESWRFWKK